ncbi:MAG: protein kinase [Dokdonella sp.]
MIEIPGYRLLRQLGRGGMATVYLAIQQSVDREVALKVMSPALLADPNFGERFLREARIAARLHHRHVVGIHDIGRADDHHYIAMEYIAGGPVLAKGEQARPVVFALQAIREIATALDYAHEKGFIHRDVKPDNILLRDDSSAVLTDFGIARANDSATRMTRTGAIVGTPHYMSPEQARGKQIDGRADLYSLGIVLYELLVGRVPYHADDSLAVGIMHITQPVPQLPVALDALQPLIEKLLAKDPADRYQSGNEVAAAINEIGQRLDAGELSQLADAPREYQREAYVGDTYISPPPIAGDNVHYRAEPNMGRLEDISIAESEHDARGFGNYVRRPAPVRRKKRGLFLFLLVLILFACIGAYAWSNQDRLRALLPSSEINNLLTRGQRALDEGRLVGNHGDSARELFQSASALDPDNATAHSALAKVGTKLLEQARAAIQRNDLTAAQQALDNARELLGGGLAVDAVAQELAQHRSQASGEDDALAKAQAALEAGRILGADGAAAQFQSMLASDATNALARAGLKKCADQLIPAIGAAFKDGDADGAATRIEELAGILPDYPALPDLRGRLAQINAQAQAQMQAQTVQQLRRAQEQLRAGRISGGADSAMTLFQTVLKSEPDNTAARAGVRKVAQALVVQAEAAIEDDHVSAAEKLLAQADSLAPGLADAHAARVKLREVRERAEIAASKPELTSADQAHVRQLIADAQTAANAGRLIVPPGDSAYDKYRAALAIDRDNPDALDGMASLPMRAKELCEQQMVTGDLGRAEDKLEALRQIAPADPAIAGLQRRLADALFEKATELHGSGRNVDAARALDSARKLNPDDPRIAALAAQLR